MRRTNDAGVVGAAVALAGALLLLGAAVARALVSVPAMAPAAVTSLDGEGVDVTAYAPLRAGHDALPGEVLDLAAERAPFAPDRRPPSQRYLMPGERVRATAPPPAPPPELPPAPDFRVLGTVAGPDGGVAVLQVEGEAPRVVSMGQELLGYTVAAIDGGSVLMSGQGRDLRVAVAGADPTGAQTAAATGARGQGGRGGGPGGRGGGPGGRAGAASAEQQQMIQQAMRERAEAMARQMSEQTGGPVQLRMDGNVIILTGPGGVRREIQVPGGMMRAAPQPGRPGGGR